MKKLGRPDFDRIKARVYRIARPVELSLWQYHFEDGSKEAVMRVLSAYQNKDGGFGHGLEPDNWNPDSTPATTSLMAINIMDEIAFCDSHHPITQGILKFLDSGSYMTESGWPWTIPSNDKYAHAPWYNYEENPDKNLNLDVTTHLIGFILKNAESNSQIYKKALMLADKIMGNEFRDIENPNFSGIGGFYNFLSSIEKAGIGERYNCKALTEKVIKLVNESIERDVTKWGGWVARPSTYINSADSIFYSENEEIMDINLDYIIANIVESCEKFDSWDVTLKKVGWYWFEENTPDQYRLENFIGANCWEIIDYIHNIIILRNFNRLD